MRVIKFTHSCVRLEAGDHAVVIDPGTFCEEEPLDGADAVFITHEHVDHFDEDKLARHPDLPIWTNAAVAEKLSRFGSERVHAVAHGDSFSVGGFTVTVHGERHELIHPDLPPVPNVGFLVDEAFFHPGDAFTVPDRPVRAIMVPLDAPWMRIADSVDYVRSARPTLAIAAHDGMLNEIGLKTFDGVLTGFAERAGVGYRRLVPGQSIEF